MGYAMNNVKVGQFTGRCEFIRLRTSPNIRVNTSGTEHQGHMIDNYKKSGADIQSTPLLIYAKNNNYLRLRLFFPLPFLFLKWA